MSVQDQSGSTNSNTTLSAGDGASVGGAQLKKQLSDLSCGNEFAPKARKPYTITKQRERWTEEEHKKFLEALKLYGRAWRQIEEHVGTKTAVQIRSHAQKFFSKVVRETSADNTNTVEAIEIPPPRPKRKPMHPYPRKLAHSNSLNKETLISEQPVSPTSPNLTVSELENRSPTSVLSVVGSDAQGSLDSNSRNGSPSPVSSAPAAPGDNPDGTSLSGSPIPEEHIPVKLELFPKDHKCEKESAVEEAPYMRSLKLFGRTMLVTDSHMPSPTVKDREDKHVQTEKMNHARTHFPQSETSNLMKPASEAALPWWSFCGGIPYPSLPNQNLNGSDSEGEDKETQKEGSWTGSNSGSPDTESDRPSVDNEEEEPVPSPKFGLSSRSAFSKPIATSNKPIVKGFVPYKRCLAERDMQSSTISSEDREAQRVRLCL